MTDEKAALAFISNSTTQTILVLNSPNFAILSALKSKNPKSVAILVTDLPMSVYSSSLESKEAELVDFVISYRSDDEWVVNELRITIHKILSNDLFGIDKYLIPETPIQSIKVEGSAQREALNKTVQDFVERHEFSNYTAKLAFGVTEELLMNAVFDAPAAAGVIDPSSIKDASSVKLDPEHRPSLMFGCDGKMLAIGIRDPFGLLQREKLMEYVRKVIRRDEDGDIIDRKVGGAGLGLLKILYNSHGLVCNVDPGKMTEVIALLNLNEQLRDFKKAPRSVHYFSPR